MTRPNNPSIIGVGLYQFFLVDSPTASFFYLTVANNLAQGGNGGIVAMQIYWSHGSQ
jgi:hypothetical protein